MSKSLYNADRKMMRDRARHGLCLNCGRADWVDAIDNHGQSYKGCAHCVIASIPAPSETPAPDSE